MMRLVVSGSMAWALRLHGGVPMCRDLKRSADGWPLTNPGGFAPWFKMNVDCKEELPKHTDSVALTKQNQDLMCTDWSMCLDRGKETDTYYHETEVCLKIASVNSSSIRY